MAVEVAATPSGEQTIAFVHDVSMTGLPIGFDLIDGAVVHYLKLLLTTRFAIPANSANDLSFDPKGRLYGTDTSEMYVLDATGKDLFSFEVRQAFGTTFDQTGALYVASRPYVVKYLVDE